MSFARFGFLIAIAAFTAGPDVVRADEDDTEQDEARHAVQGGAILPLMQILARLPPGVAAEIVRVKLKDKGGRRVYELRRVDAQGRVSEIIIDAATGAQLGEEDD